MAEAHRTEEEFARDYTGQALLQHHQGRTEGTPDALFS